MIGVFDSGLGGVSVLREIRREMPDASLHYVSDSAWVPYGPRGDEELTEAARALLAVQRARLRLGNAKLAEIRDQLQEDEAALAEGIESLDEALEALRDVERVLAATQPIAGTGWGLVAKIDLAEVQRPFLIAAAVSRIAEAAVDAALSRALAESRATYGTPREESGEPARMTVIALGKLGGGELNYSSDIDLLFLYSGDGRTDAALSEVATPRVPRGDRDLGAESMFEYGSRVGFWRIHRLFQDRGVPLTAFTCAVALERNPEITRAIAESDCDVVARARLGDHFAQTQPRARITGD